MATYAYINGYFAFNTVNLSAHCKTIRYTRTAELKDDTAHGDTAVSFKKGLEADRIEVEFNADFASGAVDATLSGVGVGGSAAFEIRPVNTTVAATNPKWTGTAFLESYEPVGGTVGDLAMARATFVVSGGSTRGES